MTIEIKVPMLPESVADATVLTWHKKVGDAVKDGENLVDLETDKVVLEVPAPMNGVLQSILKDIGATVTANEVLAKLTEGTAAGVGKGAAVGKEAPAAIGAKVDLSPAVRRIVSAENIATDSIQGSGKGGRITREDLSKGPGHVAAPAATTVVTMDGGDRTEKRVPMSRLRSRIAERLIAAQHNTATLTTFNEINLQAVMDLRQRYKDQFEKAHDIRLGFMSFFTKAVVEALKRFPDVNASIDGDDIIYHGYYDIGIAVSSPRGLVVPVIRNADQMSLAQIEKAISEYAAKAQAAKLTVEEMTGGTFTITNGGVFGSLLATPILNPPQSAILGMHKIQQRPVVENGQIVIRPMMYVALSYDHRIIDGKESVTFLTTIKDFLEDPSRLLLDI